MRNNHGLFVPGNYFLSEQSHKGKPAKRESTPDEEQARVDQLELQADEPGNSVKWENNGGRPESMDVVEVRDIVHAKNVPPLLGLTGGTALCSQVEDASDILVKLLHSARPAKPAPEVAAPSADAASAMATAGPSAWMAPPPPVPRPPARSMLSLGPGGGWPGPFVSLKPEAWPAPPPSFKPEGAVWGPPPGMVVVSRHRQPSPRSFQSCSAPPSAPMVNTHVQLSPA
jgi:hypothetical protein